MECRRYRHRPSRRWIYLLTLVFGVLGGCYLFWRTHGSSHYQELKLSTPFFVIFSSPPEDTQCPSIPGLNDIHVILKTGATEALTKLPIHSNTTLQCIPYFTILSDYEEEISGLHTYDVLRGVDDRVKSTNPDFELYTSLRDSRREAISTWSVTDDESTPSGKPNNPAWVLDKWKFLPMMHETLTVRTDANCPVQIRDSLFAHGGSGFVLSHAALERVTEFHSTRVKEWDEFTAQEWAGDYVLGKALKDAGVGLLWSKPMLQGATPWSFDYISSRYGKSPWCYPPVTYHHMTPDDIRAFWDFERNWRRENGNTLLLHRDIFQQLIEPGLNKVQQGWDTESPDLIKGVRNEKKIVLHAAPTMLNASNTPTSRKIAGLRRWRRVVSERPGLFQAGWSKGFIRR